MVHRAHLVFVENGTLIGSAIFAQLAVECPITLQCAAYFTMCCYVFPQNCPFPLWDWVLHLTHHMVPMAKRHLDRFSCFCMGPKCCAVQCVVSGEENPKTVPSPRDFVTLPDEDQPTAIGNMHRKTGKDCTCGMEISFIIIILWAGVQPTLDPYAEAFIAGPLR